MNAGGAHSEMIHASLQNSSPRILSNTNIMYLLHLSKVKVLNLTETLAKMTTIFPVESTIE